ncbi:hypothetical protein LPJ78_000264 [Coemansia sp. RSA 989]|nr:hypothetical protein BX667DRAFT_502356 [Coemansia mojavensis]KAJ1738849.1 hypothetical protein LPJ68_005190 [Coemansia sp. RSA 1086]KAJ1752707.1 hypothetical protein LPJ79_000963 [Coemansia sp. RSA 1821]KAJ1868326.1 hypothetical protein LPJ78_000264 [Coemansia sp. RSA 989]KAJ1875561.1 hypothetical protein LPJ55_000554 [Coemansia sp. RSA 990]KAJ2673155.1 hypothetical protein IWW42_002440 [Coemansia sp. RSA 1085]
MSSVVSSNMFDLLQDNATSTDDVKTPKKQQQKKQQTGTRPERAQPTASVRSGYPSRGGFRGSSGRDTVRAADPVVEQDRRGRGGHGPRGREAYRGRGRQFDRHSGTGLVDSAKKEKQGWLGSPEDMPADAEKAAEQARKDAQTEPSTPQNEEEEPEPAVKSLDDYLNERSQQAVDKKHEIRKANQGVDQSQLKQGVELTKKEEEFFPSTVVRRTRKNKERKEKVIFDGIEQTFSDQQRGAFRGGRGPRSDRRQNARQARVNLNDKNAFPAL